MDPVHRPPPLRYRTIWISDLHLGSKACKADFLLDFLRNTRCERLYLVGDIIDLWAIQRNGIYWPQSHSDVVRLVHDKARQGTNVVYIPGNHDAALREFDGSTFGGISIQQQDIHLTAVGKRLLVLHGDTFDAAIRCAPLARRCGSYGYDALLWANRAANRIRRTLGLPYWSLAAYTKSKFSKAAQHMRDYELAAIGAARRQAVDGVVCGHIHRAGLRLHDGILYCNDGDWVESCTALAEDARGSLHRLHWADHKRTVKCSEALVEPAADDDLAA